MLEEGELVGLAARGGLDVEVVELVGRARRGRVHEAAPVEGNVRLGAVEALLLQHRDPLVDAVLAGRNPVDVSAAQRHVPVGDHEELVAGGQPCGRDVHVPGPEVEAVAPEAVVIGDGDLLAGPGAVRERADVDVEIAAGFGGDVGEAAAVRREARVHVDLVVVGEPVGLAGLRVEHLQLDGAAPRVGGVDQPAPVRRPVGRGEVVSRADQLGGDARGRVHAPDRAAHAHGDPLAVRRPRRIPRGGAGGGREVEVVHVVAPVGGRGVLALGAGGRGPGHGRQHAQGGEGGERGGGRRARGAGAGRAGGRADGGGVDRGHSGVSLGVRWRCGAGGPPGRATHTAV